MTTKEIIELLEFKVQEIIQTSETDVFGMVMQNTIREHANDLSALIIELKQAKN